MMSVKSFFLVNWFKHLRTRWINFTCPIAITRLKTTIEVFEPELNFLIHEATQQAAGNLVGAWDQKARDLLNSAKNALRDHNTELGWRCLKAADRFSFYGLDDDALRSEASLILVEANDEDKGLTKWRKKSIQDLLADDAGKLKSSLHRREIIRAKRILDEHGDNIYQKQVILKYRLRLLSIIALIAITVWIVILPISPSVYSSTAFEMENNIVPARCLWFALILSGVLGAIFSGFSSSFATDQRKVRIPSELSTSTITFARFALAMVSAIAISIFLLSGVLNIPRPSFELMLAVAFASGFSDRLLIGAIDSVLKR